MVKSKFELPESIFSVTKGLPNKSKKPFRITQNLPINTNKPLQKPLNFLTKILPYAESNTQKYLKMTKWLIIIGLTAITVTFI